MKRTWAALQIALGELGSVKGVCQFVDLQMLEKARNAELELCYFKRGNIEVCHGSRLPRCPEGQP